MYKIPINFNTPLMIMKTIDVIKISKPHQILKFIFKTSFDEKDINIITNLYDKKYNKVKLRQINKNSR